MSEKEALEQLDSLIEAWDFKEADINQTDINAIKFILQKNQKLKEQLKQKDEVIDKVIELLEYYYIGNLRYDKESQRVFRIILSILSKCKGDNNG